MLAQLYMWNLSGFFKLFQLPGLASVFTAECVALLEAINFVLESSAAPSKFLILSDSRSALDKLRSSPFDHPDDAICLRIRERLLACKDRGLDVAMAWIPSHCGIPGNEFADCFARLAVESGSGAHSEVPISDIFPLARESGTELGRSLVHLREDTLPLFSLRSQESPGSRP